MKSKKLFTSFLVSVVTMMLCLVSFAGTTLAWFTDTVSNTGNKIQAGTLDVELYSNVITTDDEGHTITDTITIGDTVYYNISNVNKPVFDYNLWEPGYSTPAGFVIKNAGNLALKYKLSFSLIDSKTGLEQLDADYPEEAAKTEGQLQEYLDKKAHLEKCEANTKLENVIEVYQGETKLGTLKDFFDGTKQFEGELLLQDDTASISNLKLLMPTTAGNEYENASISFDIKLLATQKTYENDGFDSNLYDLSAEYPVQAEAKYEEGESTTLVAYDGDNKQNAKAVIPVNAENIPEGTTKIIMEIDNTDKPEAIHLEDGQASLNVDISFYSVKGDGTKTQITDFGNEKFVPVDLSAVIPNGYELVNVYNTHDPVHPTQFEPVGSKDALDDGKFYYDSANKMMYLASSKFSPFTFVVDQCDVLITKNGDESFAPVGMKLSAFRDSVNNGERDHYAGYTATLQRDVNLNNVEWTPIGTSANPFSGVFDGKNHTIKNLTYNGAPTGSDLGLFGVVNGNKNQNVEELTYIWNNNTFNQDAFAEENYTAIIKNVNIDNFHINNTSGDGSNRHTGALVGRTVNTYIANVNVSNSTIKGKKGVGGIGGTIDGSVAINCKTGTNVIAESTTGGYTVGGLFGGVNYKVSGGSLTKYCAVINCENNAEVIIDSDGATGGFAGGIVAISQSGTAETRCAFYVDCINNGKMTINCEQQRVGGIVGNGINGFAFIRCKNNGNIIAKNITSGIAGIEGLGCGSFYNCVNTGDITASSKFMAGIVVEDASNSGTVAIVSDCSNSGNLNNEYQGDDVQTANITASSKTLIYNNKVYASTNDINNIISNNPTVNIIEFNNCTVSDSSGVLSLANTNIKLYSNNKLANSLDVTSVGSGNYVNISVPDLVVSIPSGIANTKEFSLSGNSNTITIQNGANIKYLTVSGNNSQVTVYGHVDSLSLNGNQSVTAVIEENATAGHVGFGGTGTYELTNKGTISHTQSESNQYANEHTVSTITAGNITINNYGKIEAKKNSNGINSVSCLFYNGCTVVVNNYHDSSIVADNGYVLACGSAQSVVYNYYNAQGGLDHTDVKK